MKKLLILMLAMMPVISFAGSIFDGVIEGTDCKSYEDSIVSVSIYAAGNDNTIGIVVINKTNSRLYIEWENCRINQNFIAFNEDRMDNFYSKRQDEMIMSKKATVRRVWERSLLPQNIFKWKDKIATGDNKVTLDLAFHTPEHVHDISIIFVLKEE